VRIVLVHYPNRYEGPDSIYWVDQGNLRSHEAEIRPEVVLGRDSVLRKVNVTWEEFFEQLALRDPYTDYFDTFMLRTEEDPKSFLDILRRATARATVDIGPDGRESR
jgi:hypothetical protein